MSDSSESSNKASLSGAGNWISGRRGTGARPMRFVAIDYRQDFAFVREIDDSFDPRIGQFADRGP